jgi:hypothetical protein
MSPAEFEPAIPAIELPQTHALDCATSGIGSLFVYESLITSPITTVYKCESYFPENTDNFITNTGPLLSSENPV